jgi:outer membrane protein
MKAYASILFAFYAASISISAAAPISLTLAQAREQAETHHPRISAAEFRVLAAKEVTVEARSAFFPTLTANATAVGTSQDNTRLAAGSLSNPGIYERNAEGINISQLITDFGRTANLTRTAKLKASAQEEEREATRAQILVLVDSAFFNALRAQSVLNVATQTLATRELLLNQVSTLASNQLKSDLDVNFARVSLDEGKLLLLDAQSEVEAGYTRLSSLLGYTGQQEFILQPEPLPTNNVGDVSALVTEALRERPELRELRLEHEAALKFAKAEHALHYPTISVLAAAGVIPVRDEAHFEKDYAVAGVNLSLPLYAGGLHHARAQEARYRAEAVEELLRDKENEVIRDVRIAFLNLNKAHEKIAVTEKLLQHAIQTYALAEAKYHVGSSSIVELSQAQLSKTVAEIAAASATFDYQIQHSLLDLQVGRISSPKK